MEHGVPILNLVTRYEYLQPYTIYYYLLLNLNLVARYEYLPIRWQSTQYPDTKFSDQVQYEYLLNLVAILQYLMLNLAAMYDYGTKFSTLQLYPIYPVLNLVKGTSTYPTT